MLYVLIGLVVMAMVLSVLGVLPFRPVDLMFSATFLTATCWATNRIFVKVFKAPTNLESVYITALILALILTPIKSVQELPLLFWVAVWAMASKYILAIKKKHIFNPAALSVALTALTLNYSASWWVVTAWMAPFVAVGGLLIVRKIRRFDMVFSFFVVASVVILGASALKGNDLLLTAQRLILDIPILFFAFVMLTEPLTTPARKIWQVVYGSLVGILFAPFIHLGFFYFTPETALLVGNIFSYIVSPKEKLLLMLKEKIQIAPDIYDFVFGLDEKLNFLPGQYMEWTLGHENPDSRGSRRYFTIAASPTEENLRIGIKFYPNGSSFKKALIALQSGDAIVASQLAGEFTLPKDPNKKLAFIAGGIGVTPYRSMIKYLLDLSQKRDIILLYSNKLASDIVYKEIFDEALQKLGIKTVYVLTDSANVPAGWSGRVGFIDTKMIAEGVPDFKDRTFYISGPHSMVDAFEKQLKAMGVPGNQLKADFFPGYA